MNVVPHPLDLPFFFFFFSDIPIYLELERHLHLQQRISHLPVGAMTLSGAIEHRTIEALT